MREFSLPYALLVVGRAMQVKGKGMMIIPLDPCGPFFGGGGVDIALARPESWRGKRAGAPKRVFSVLKWDGNRD